MNTRLRSAGIWISNAHIMLESLVNHEVWGIPGGFVEESESVEQACLREYLEETGHALKCERLAIVHELFWNKNGQAIRENGFYFIDCPTTNLGAQPRIESLEGNMQFGWHQISKLNTIDFVPRVLQVYLSDLPRDTLFIITGEEDA